MDSQRCILAKALMSWTETLATKGRIDCLKHDVTGWLATMIVNGKCTHCGDWQPLADVLNGASASPYDITTECTECHKRYVTTLYIQNANAPSEAQCVPWMAPLQTRDQYQLYGVVELHVLLKTRPDIYWNAVMYATQDYPHYGVRRAVYSFLRK